MFECNLKFRQWATVKADTLEFHYVSRLIAFTESFVCGVFLPCLKMEGNGEFWES